MTFSDMFEKTFYAGKKLLVSTGKAAWILGTSFLIIVLPVIVEMDREAIAQEFENQQLGVLTNPQIPGAASPGAPSPNGPQRK